jgi:Na+/melibiose symporter-like transporter
MGAIRRALGQRGLRLLLGAGLISATGDWVLRVGLAYYVYVLTGSTVASALVMLASFIPQIVLGSVAGVFVDRWDARRTMVISNLLLAAGLLPLLAARHAGQAWIIYAVLAWEGCVQQFFTPAEQALLPRLIDDDHLVTANALNGQTSDMSRLVGSAVGGVVAATGGITALAFADIASFLISAALIARISAAARVPRAARAPRMHRAARAPRAAQGPGSAGVRGSLRRRVVQLRTEWTDGLRTVTRQRVLRVILIFLLITCVGEGIMSTLFAPFVRSVLHGSAADYGLIVSAQAVGGIAGGLIGASAGHRIRASVLLGWGAVTFGAVDLVLFLYPLAWVAVWPAAVCMVVVGVPGALMLAGAMTLLQRNAADSHRGRVFGALGAVEGVAIVAGTIAAGFLGQTVGIIPVLATQGGGYVLAGLLVVVALRHEALVRPQPGEGPGTQPAENPDQQPGEGRRTQPGRGSRSRPGEGPRPEVGRGTQPAESPDQQPGEGPAHAA